jgi:hypothetical protein
MLDVMIYRDNPKSGFVSGIYLLARDREFESGSVNISRLALSTLLWYIPQPCPKPIRR